MTLLDAPQPLVLGKRIEDLEVLARNPLLAHLDLRELGTLLDRFERVDFPEGTAVLREGEEGEHTFFILAGEARSERNHFELGRLHAGDQFGELSLIGIRRRPLTVQAVTDLRVARLSSTRFAALAAGHPAIALHLLQALVASLGHQLTAMIDDVGALVRERSLPRPAEVRVIHEGQERVIGTGRPIKTLVPTTAAGEPVVAALLDHKPVSLEARVVSDVTVGALTLAASEGREVYRRSVALVMLEAASRVAADHDLCMGPSFGAGQVVYVARPEADAAALAARITRAMQTILAEAPAFREEMWTTEEARAHFVERSWADAAALLRTSREPTTRLVTCGEVYALHAGPLLGDVSAIGDVGVRAHPDGLVLDFGAAIRSHLPSRHGVVADPFAREATAPRHGGEMARAHRLWLVGMGVTSVGALNAMCISGQVNQLVRVSEGFHEKRIGKIADAIVGREGLQVIAIAGPSSSGKTTFIKRLTVQLEVNGVHPVTLSLDDYYVDRDRTPRDAEGALDFEALEAIDLTRLREHVTRLLAGESVKTARFDFVAGTSLPAGGPELRLGAHDVLLVEGIHGLHPALLGDQVNASNAFRVFVHPVTALPLDHLSRVAPEDIRLLRRIVRDRHGRGYSAADTIARWEAVRRGDELSIFPNLVEADAIFDTALVYEPSVLKIFAERYLLEVPEEHPSFATAFRLRRLLDAFVAIYPDHVPPTSIVREFIGGSGFEY